MRMCGPLASIAWIRQQPARYIGTKVFTICVRQKTRPAPGKRRRPPKFHFNFSPKKVTESAQNSSSFVRKRFLSEVLLGRTVRRIGSIRSCHFLRDCAVHTEGEYPCWSTSYRLSSTEGHGRSAVCRRSSTRHTCLRRASILPSSPRKE